MNRIAVVTLALALIHGTVYAFDLNDCIINGMKGVSSDVAARQIRWACEQKDQEYKKQRTQQLLRDYGSPLDTEALKMEKNWAFDEIGFHSMEFINTTSDRTVTYVRLSVAPAPNSPPGAPCDPSKERIHAYTITLKPGARIKLIYPSSVEKGECISLKGALGRPTSWKDVSFFSSAKPADNDPLAGLD